MAVDTIINLMSLVLVFVLPIIVWRWDIFGVLLGTLIFEISIITFDMIRMFFYPEESTPFEIYEFWWSAWLIGLFYCLIIFALKFLYLLGRRMILTRKSNQDDRDDSG
jgi:hypothetical protein